MTRNRSAHRPKAASRLPFALAFVAALTLVAATVLGTTPAEANMTSCPASIQVEQGGSSNATVSMNSPDGGAFLTVSASGVSAQVLAPGARTSAGSWSNGVRVSAGATASGSGSVTVTENGATGPIDSCTISVSIIPTTTTTTTSTTTTTTTTRPPTTTTTQPPTTTTSTTTTTVPPTTTTSSTTTTSTTTTTTTTVPPTTTSSTTTSTTAPPFAVTTLPDDPAAIGSTDGGGSDFLSENWWWLTIIGLVLIALIASVAVLRPDIPGFGGRVRAAGPAAATRRRPDGRPGRRGPGQWLRDTVSPDRYARRPGRVRGPSVGQRVRQTKVAQGIEDKVARPKVKGPSLWQRIRNASPFGWFRDSEIADSFRARSSARKVRRDIKRRGH